MCCLGLSAFFPQGVSFTSVNICSDFGAQENGLTVFILSPNICLEVMGQDAII